MPRGYRSKAQSSNPNSSISYNNNQRRRRRRHSDSDSDSTRSYDSSHSDDESEYIEEYMVEDDHHQPPAIPPLLFPPTASAVAATGGYPMGAMGTPGTSCRSPPRRLWPLADKVLSLRAFLADAHHTPHAMAYGAGYSGTNNNNMMYNSGSPLLPSGALNVLRSIFASKPSVSALICIPHSAPAVSQHQALRLVEGMKKYIGTPMVRRQLTVASREALLVASFHRSPLLILPPSMAQSQDAAVSPYLVEPPNQLPPPLHPRLTPRLPNGAFAAMWCYKRTQNEMEGAPSFVLRIHKKVIKWKRRWMVIGPSSVAWYSDEQSMLLPLEGEWWSKKGPQKGAEGDVESGVPAAAPSHAFQLTSLACEPSLVLHLDALEPPPPAHVRTGRGFNLSLRDGSHIRRWVFIPETAAGLRVAVGMLRGCYAAVKRAQGGGDYRAIPKR